MDAERFDALLAALVTAPSRRVALGVLGGLGLAGLVGRSHARKRRRRKKKCAKAGQKISKKRKRCCKGLAKDATKRCGCTPGACPANQICLRDGACQPCTVTCTGTPAECGSALQAAMDGGGTLYVCPGRYQGGFVLNTAVRIIGAGEGSGAADTILDANDVQRVLEITSGVGPVELERLRLSDGKVSGPIPGAGIYHAGSLLRLTACTVSGNTAEFAGGGIASVGTLEMTRCTVRDNHVLGSTGLGGGGIFTQQTTNLTDCLVADNRADVGGGLTVWLGSTTLAGSTQVRDNASVGIGGGISVNTGSLSIAETCRVTENTAAVGEGGGIFNSAGTVDLAGADPSPAVVNNCHENCVGTVPACAATPVSCPP